MHAVVVTSVIRDSQNARTLLHEEVIPSVKQTPGFVSGLWLAPIDLKAVTVVVFENEEAARAMASQLHPGTHPNEFVAVESVEVREVAGNA